MRLRFVVLASMASLLACVGDSGSQQDAGSDAQPDVAQPVDAGVDAPKEAAAPTYTIGGTVHFLQAAGGDAGVGLVLANGSDQVTVTQAGTFAFAAKASSYDVSILTNPPGQVCSVRNASGKGTASADVTSIVIGCTIAMQSTGATTQYTMSSKTPVAIPSLSNIAFSTDVASKALVSLMLPSIGLPTSSFDDIVTAIQLDGADVTSGQWGNQNNIGQGAHTIYGIIDVPAGAHTLGATWHTFFNFGANTATAYAGYPAQLDIVVLDSLSVFTSTAHGTGTASQSNSSSAPASLMTDVAFTTSAPSPVLALMQAPQVQVSSNSSSAFAKSSFALSADSTVLSTGQVNGYTQDDAVFLVGLSTLGTGTHALKAAWADPTTAYTVYSKIAPRMDAIVLSPNAHVASSTTTSNQTTSQSTFSSVPGLSPLALTASTATKALVILHTDASAGGSDTDAGGEMTVALDNQAIGGGVGAVTSSIALAAYPLTFIQLVDVPAGSHTFQAQFRATNLDVNTGAGTSGIMAILIE
jgi:hypothetical protein